MPKYHYLHQWGGAREDAGRPAKDRQRATVYLSKENLKWLDAERGKMSRSDILNLVIDEARAQLKLIKEAKK